jgi:S1-C subfamily serine protease
MRQVLSPAIFLTALCLALAPYGSATADTREAIDAYDKGDYATVLRECAAAAKGGDSICQDLLGLLYSEGKGVKADPIAAARWFRLAAEQGNPVAAYNLARAYLSGEGVAKDPNEAEKWLRAAAEKGVAFAQAQLGLIMINDHKDWKSGIKLIRPAAAQGIPDAQALLGLAYQSGNGVRRNARLAITWYETAADHGSAIAQSRLAASYERGNGVDVDFKEAYFWYAVALRDPKTSTRKDDEAGLKRTAAKLSKTDLDEAAATARDWKPLEIAIRPQRTTKGKTRNPETSQGPHIVATGSGFYVTRNGYLVTNNHVVAQCREVRVTENDKGVPVKIVAVDPDRDLAILLAPHPVQASAVFRGDEPTRPGETIVVVGFPLSGLLSTDAIVTSGIVSALAGARNDRRQLQISAPIQPGNSGGPAFDASGHVIGVAVASLSTVRLAQATGVIPENINFAVKGEEAKQFLGAHNVAIATASIGKELSTAAIADQALKITVRLECWK